MPKTQRALTTKRQLKRAQIAALHATSLSRKEIAEKAGVSKRTVTRWTKEIETNPETPLEELILDRSRAGRPPKATKAVQHRILLLGKGKRNRSTRKIARKLKQDETADISHETVRSVLAGTGLHPYRRRDVPKLSQKNIADRIRFAKKYLRRQTDFRIWLWTDETDFIVTGPTNKKNDIVWDRDASQVPSRVHVKYPTKLRSGEAFPRGGKPGWFSIRGPLITRPTSKS